MESEEKTTECNKLSGAVPSLPHKADRPACSSYYVPGCNEEPLPSIPRSTAGEIHATCRIASFFSPVSRWSIKQSSAAGFHSVGQQRRPAAVPGPQEEPVDLLPRVEPANIWWAPAPRSAPGRAAGRAREARRRRKVWFARVIYLVNFS